MLIMNILIKCHRQQLIYALHFSFIPKYLILQNNLRFVCPQCSEYGWFTLKSVYVFINL